MLLTNDRIIYLIVEADLNQFFSPLRNLIFFSYGKPKQEPQCLDVCVFLLLRETVQLVLTIVEQVALLPLQDVVHEFQLLLIVVATVHESLVYVETVRVLLDLQLLSCHCLRWKHVHGDYRVVLLVDLILLQAFNDFLPVNCITILHPNDISIAKGVMATKINILRCGLT